MFVWGGCGGGVCVCVCVGCVLCVCVCVCVCGGGWCVYVCVWCVCGCVWGVFGLCVLLGVCVCVFFINIYLQHVPLHGNTTCSSVHVIHCLSFWSVFGTTCGNVFRKITNYHSV